MRLLAAAALVALLAALRPPPPEDPARVVRAWRAALNRGDNEAAANLFAKNAVVIQNGLRLVLSTHHLAVLWNEGLPCSGRILKVTVRRASRTRSSGSASERGSSATHRGSRRAPPSVVHGKIVRWAQLPVPKPTAAPA